MCSWRVSLAFWKIEFGLANQVTGGIIMSKVYAIATDAICNGQSVRDSYTVARAPYEDEESAISQIDEVVSELEDMYKSLETPEEQILVKAIDEKTKVIVKNSNGEETPLIRCTVLGVDMSARTSVCSSSFLKSGSSKKATQEQKHQNALAKKIRQYVATQTPTSLNTAAVHG